MQVTQIYQNYFETGDTDPFQTCPYWLGLEIPEKAIYEPINQLPKFQSDPLNLNLYNL